MAGAPHPWAITPALEWFVGWHDWEGQLNDRDRHQLASTCAAFEPRDEIELPFQDFEGLTEGEEADPLSRCREAKG